MNKTELVEQIAKDAGLNKAEAGRAVDAFTGAVESALVKGDNVALSGFGSFQVRHRAGRTGINPRNPKEQIQIPPAKVPAFKAGKKLKLAVKGS